MQLQKSLKKSNLKQHNKKTEEKKLKQNSRRLLVIQERQREPIMTDNEQLKKILGFMIKIK